MSNSLSSSSATTRTSVIRLDPPNEFAKPSTLLVKCESLDKNLGSSATAATTINSTARGMTTFKLRGFMKQMPPDPVADVKQVAPIQVSPTEAFIAAEVGFTTPAEVPSDSQKLDELVLATAVRGRCLCGSVEWFLSAGEACKPDEFMRGAEINSDTYTGNISSDKMIPHVGQCLCCNCSLCRRSTGALNVAFGGFPRSSVLFTRYESTLKRFRVSEVAERGFCSGCGALIFMDYFEKETIWMSFGVVLEESFPLLERILARYRENCKQHESTEGIQIDNLNLEQSEVKHDDPPENLPRENPTTNSILPLAADTRPAYPPSHVFSESRCRGLFALVDEFPPLEKFGNYVPDCCAQVDDGNGGGGGDGGGGNQQGIRKKWDQYGWAREQAEK